MVKEKATPGKRYCKKCKKLIPIHSRICSFCSAPQYTMQQITKEYKKRQKCSETQSFVKGPEELFFISNPFETKILKPISLEANLEAFLLLSDINLILNDRPVTIKPLLPYTEPGFSILNTCGKTNTLAFSYGYPAYLCISIAPCEILYGKAYEGDGILQLWEVSSKPVYKYSLVHHGFTVLSMKFFPTKQNLGIGTLAACLANGDLCIYNLPIVDHPVLRTEPIEIFRIPGLIFSCVVWMNLGFLAVGTQDGSIFVLRPGFDPIIKIFAAHKLPITSLTYISASESLASTGLDGNLKVWNKDGGLVDKLCLSKRWSYHICHNPIGKYLFYDNDAAVSPHKVILFDNSTLESKKQLSHSTEATLCSYFSHASNFDYIVSAEGLIESIYVSELEKNSKKRKTPWNRYNKIVYQEVDDKIKICTESFIPDKIPNVSLGSIKRIDLVAKNQNSELIAWVGETCGIYEFQFDAFNS